MSSVDVREQLVIAKKHLVQALEDNEKMYWANMKAWFKHQISKEEFDCQSRKLLPKDKVYLHNQFLLAVLTKCQITTASSVVGKGSQTVHAANKEKKNKRIQALKRKFDNRFVPENPTAHLPPVPRQVQSSLSAPQQPIKSCSKTLEIPTATEMIGFVSVISWEMGLDDNTDEVVAIATESVRVFLKNLLTAICSRRSAYKLYNGVRYDVGHQPPNPYLMTRTPVHMAARPGFQELEQENAETLSRSSREDVPPKYPINMYDLYHCLKVHRKSIIPSHTIYSFAMERIISHLWHPDHEDLKQDAIFEKSLESR